MVFVNRVRGGSEIRGSPGGPVDEHGGLIMALEVAGMGCWRLPSAPAGDGLRWLIFAVDHKSVAGLTDDLE